eukprot:CAMPEP_0116556084 /NCGR_PEP_ID=MMETSP0397-20121206/8500_1 /TAXON_ID=216820 /ORGANISM="Cyclophora tenuis, Strain ECT3854" /LENGTH=275 /DNA_ID=CAMNT_0004081415 /DNA_START=94 /DNA_END=921 /DNA_ORIENTATION=-
MSGPPRLSSRVRLVGVGRAYLAEFFYKLPTPEDSDEDSEEPLSRQTPIVMAEFHMLSDSAKATQASLANIGNKGAQSANSAPVFFVNKLGRLANSVTRLHEERRKLSLGLTAAKARLENLNVFEDSDGIGMIGKREEEQEALQYLLSNFSEPSKPSSMNDVVQLENYGVNNFASFSSIPKLTDVALEEVLTDFYSPEKQQSEEHRYEMLSFVAFRALDGYCTPADIGWALQSTNTAERLNRAHELMMDHVIQLKRLAVQASQDLRDCGEECTDLW